MGFLHRTASVGSLVVKVPKYANFFEKIGVDYCCEGNKTLQESCDEKGLDVVEVLEELKKISPTEQGIDWVQMPHKEVIRHIVSVYHTYAKQEISRISQLLNKLNKKHGKRYTYISDLQNVFEKMKGALLEHMKEEEEIIFPLMVSEGKDAREKLGDYLDSLNKDHLETGDLLERIKQLTNNYRPPSDACVTHIVTLDSLKRLEENLHEHIHKENHILFSRF